MKPVTNNYVRMKKIIFIIGAVMSLVAGVSFSSMAQTKIGFISLQELLPSMPEYKKFDTAMSEYSNALNQQFEDMKTEFNEQNALLSSKDTIKYTKAQLELKKTNLNEMYTKLSGWQQQAQQLYQTKQQELITPIQKKALEAVQTVAKENGYTYVINKDQLLVSPATDDLLPLVKKKLAVK